MNLRSVVSVIGLASLHLALLMPAASIAEVSRKAQDASGNPGTMTRTIKKAKGSGVDVQYSIAETPRVGQPTAVLIQFGDTTDPAGGSARFTGDSGLALADADEVHLPPGEATTVTVLATPTTEGIAYINVFTTQNGVTSVTSIPIRAGTAAAKLRAGGELRKMPAGDAVISMPAR